MSLKHNAITEKIIWNLPNDPIVLQTSIKNIFIALNKANKAGAYELLEATEITKDLNILSNVINQIIKNVYAPQTETQAKTD